MTAQVTGGNPRSTGTYYDDTWNHDVFPAGTTNCSGPVPGGEAAYEEAIDINSNALDAGQGLTGLPGSILQMTGDPLQVINPKNLPVDPRTCKPIYPNQYLEVNTIFNVARAAGLRTAWSDKHPAYQMFSGPSGTGVQDYFTPEINSQDPGLPAGQDWTTDNAATMQYDSYKVQAILNEIDGYDHSGTHHVGVPGILSRDELPDRLHRAEAAYLRRADRRVPARRYGSGPAAGARAELHQHRGRRDGGPGSRPRAWRAAPPSSSPPSTGHPPTDPTTLARVPDSPIISAINAAWTAAHPGAKALVIFSTDDDGMLLWLSDRSAGGGRLREAVPAHAFGGREQRQRQPGDGVRVRAEGRLRGRGLGGVLRRPGQ